MESKSQQRYQQLEAARSAGEGRMAGGVMLLLNQYMPTSVFQKNMLACQMAASTNITIYVNLLMIYRRSDLS
jgi:hypothetical protein